MSKEKMKKVCASCGLEKIKHLDFSVNKYRKDGKCDTCRECLEKSRPVVDKNLSTVNKESTIEEWRAAFLDSFSYQDGMLFWKKKAADRINIGDRAGYQMPVGRRRIRLFGSSWQEHRVIFLMEHGYLPKIIDHIDCNPLNNKIENLRPASECENGWNKRKFSTNTSGHKNVMWNNSIKKWKVAIIANKRATYVGHFNSIEEAVSAAKNARSKLHGGFARHD